jgi:hypothetical protein
MITLFVIEPQMKSLKRNNDTFLSTGEKGWRHSDCFWGDERRPGQRECGKYLLKEKVKNLPGN